MPAYSWFIGRYQPLHTGHIKLIQTVLDEDKAVCVAIRDTGINEDNPYSIPERMAMFQERFGPEINSGQMILLRIPDVAEVCYGRGVGWGIREIRLDDETEKISATAIRRGDT